MTEATPKAPDEATLVDRFTNDELDQAQIYELLGELDRLRALEASVEDSEEAIYAAIYRAMPAPDKLLAAKYTRLALIAIREKQR